MTANCSKNIYIFNEEHVCVHDGGFILLHSTRKRDIETEVFCVEMPFVAFIERGELKCKIDEREYHLHTGDAILCLPHFFLTEFSSSPDFSYRAMGFSRQAMVRGTLQKGKDVLNLVEYKRDHPAIMLNEDEKELFRRYYSLIRIQLRSNTKPFHADIMKTLFLTVFSEICSAISVRLDKNETTEIHGVKRKDWLFTNFLRLLSEYEGRERAVSVYAERLNVSSKYLSTVVKEVSGKTAINWIQEHSAELVANELKYTDKSIKEIAFALNFSNLSFFGKFCKKYLGMSPKAYRKEHLSQ